MGIYHLKEKQQYLAFPTKKQDVNKLGSPVPTIMCKELCEKS